MFEIYSWSYRFIYSSVIMLFCILSYIIYFKNKKSLSIFLPILNISIASSSFLLLSIYSETIDKNIVVGMLILLATYITTRLIITLVFKVPSPLLYDIVFLLQTIGLCMLYRLSSEYGFKQLTFFIISNIALCCVIYIIPKFEIKIYYFKYIGILILILLILTQIFGKEIYGSKNWISILGFSFQPSEFIKILFIYFISCYFYEPLNIKRFIIISSSMLIIILFFGLQKDLGSAFIFFSVYLIMLLSVDDRLIYTIISSISALACGLTSYFIFGHIRSRVQAWLEPWKYVSSKSYQITQSLFAIASGSLFGTGINLGNPEYIPAVHTDFIFSAICEEMGILVAISIITLYSLAIIVGMNICMKCRSRLNMLVCLGLTSLNAVQTLLIICGVMNLIPITGVTLPFISYGGSSMLSQYIIIGLILNIYINEMGVSNEQVNI